MTVTIAIANRNITDLHASASLVFFTLGTKLARLFMFNLKRSFFHLFFEAIVFFHLAKYGFETLFEAFHIESSKQAWAWSWAFWFTSTYLLSWLFTWRWSVYQERIEECAKAKAKLESQLLKNRQTSDK